MVNAHIPTNGDGQLDVEELYKRFSRAGRNGSYGNSFFLFFFINKIAAFCFIRNKKVTIF